MTEIKPLAGNTVADLVAYLQQLPPDCRVDCLREEDCGDWGTGYNSLPILNSDLHYHNGKNESYLEIGQ